METLTLVQFDNSLDSVQAGLSAAGPEAIDPSQICSLVSQHGADIERIAGFLRAAAVFVPQAGKLASLLSSLWAIIQRLCSGSES